MQGIVHQVSVSKGGVPKLAVDSAWATPMGLEGDIQSDRVHHGGPKRALLLVSLGDIERLRGEGYHVAPGSLGENLTIQGIDFRQLRAGQRFYAGAALIELTKLRLPCHKLDIYDREGLTPIQRRLFDARAKAGDAGSPVWAMSGFYAAVIHPGPIAAGATIALVDQAV